MISFLLFSMMMFADLSRVWLLLRALLLTSVWDIGTCESDPNSQCSQFCTVGNVSLSICHPADGTCLDGCQPGYQGSKCDEQCDRGTYGQDCNSDCPQHCESMDTIWPVCHHISGVCTQGCLPGHTGVSCDEQCGRGTYGLDCNSTCSQHCANMDTSLPVCHHISGVCSQGCLLGYKGVCCDEQCDRGTYGQNCNSDCPQHCENMDKSYPVCHHESGICTQGCLHGHTGVRCYKQCDREIFGKDCSSTCPQHCDNMDTSLSVCHHIYGICTQGCLPGYKGARCNEQCENGYYGEKCSRECPEFCAANDPNQPVCHHIDGACLQGCEAGYLGPLCTEACSNGHYGKNCTAVCPAFCARLDPDQPVCHHVSGVCLQGCQASYRGPHCSDNCETGWFGSQCKYKCHCLDVATCWTIDTCVVNGEVACYPGWFGPGCQYVDLAQSSSVFYRDHKVHTVTDANDTTCLQPGTTALTLSWWEPHLLTWIRVRLSEAVTMLPEPLTNLFNVAFKEQIISYRCRNLQLAVYSQTTIDIYCEPLSPVTQLVLTGPGVAYLCSLSVSGGRNVALRENTSQSSTSSQTSHSDIKPESSLAVDGNTNRSFESGDCTLTDVNDRRPTWNLVFSHPVAVSRYIIYNRNKKNFWLQRFILTGRNSSGQAMFSYQDNLKWVMPVYTVIPPQVSTLSGLSIEATRSGNVIKFKYLSLCEVEVYGDTVCPHGWHGRECEHRCTCPLAETPCLVSTGLCPLQIQ